jgi:hypothetical protein
MKINIYQQPTNNEEGCQNDFSAQDNQTYITIKNIIEICLTQK